MDKYTFKDYQQIVNIARAHTDTLDTRDALGAGEGEMLRAALINGDDGPLKEVRWAIEICDKGKEYNRESGHIFSAEEIFNAVIKKERDELESQKADLIIAEQKAYMARRRVIAIGTRHGIAEVAAESQEELDYINEQAALDDLDSTYNSLGVVR